MSPEKDAVRQPKSDIKNKHGSTNVKPHRVRLTNKGAEGLQFSTVKSSHISRADALPSTSIGITSLQQLNAITEGDATPSSSSFSSERLHPNSSSMHRSPQQGHTSGSVSAHGGTSSSSSSGAVAGFDPIPQDPTFVIVPHSTYWPPPTLQALREKTGVTGSEELDLYDRREEEATAKKEKAALMKKKGELQHPRGKGPKNTIERLESSDSSSEEDNDKEKSPAEDDEL